MKKIYIKDIELNVYVELLCTISNKRQSKNIVFLDVYDSTGKLECIALKNTCDNYETIKKVTKESAVKICGKLIENSKKEFIISHLEVISLASLSLSPSPNSNNFNVLDKKYAKQVIEHPTFYIRNKRLSTIFFIKAIFKRCMQNYLWAKSFIEFESPTLTKQTLYDDKGAIWLNNEHQELSLSRCATFHLEPAIIAFEKVFTITNSHADEKVKTNRHLVEYLHLKIEMSYYTLEELIEFAAKMYYEISVETYKICQKEFLEIVDKKTIENKLERLNPKNHIIISYDEAVEILHKKGIEFKYGKSLTSKQEAIITSHFDNNFVWVKYIPYTVEGFMFKRKKDNDFLTLTCDLIAPDGFGEILGCAEKMNDYDELIKSMKQKDKYKDYNRYKDYALLHKFGLPPHGGIGMGIERALRYLIDIEHVKYIKPFAIVKHSQVNH